MEVLGRLNEASHLVIRERQTPLFARHGLQHVEFDVLATLRRSGERDGLTPTALFEAARMSSGGMTARIDRLEKAGWVERRPHPSDRRSTIVVATTETDHEVRETLGAMHQRMIAVVDGMTDEQLVAVGTFLSGMVHAVEESSTDEPRA